MKLSDQQILQGIREGSAQVRGSALRVIYVEYYPLIEKFVIANSGTRESAADIFQDAIIIFFEKVREEEFVLSSTIKTFLFAIAKNTWLNKLRGKKIDAGLDDFGVDAHLIAKCVDLEASERVDLLEKTVRKLGENCQKIITLYYFDKLRMKKIAEDMGFANQQVAKNKKMLCMKKLREKVLSSSFLVDHLK